MQHAHPDVPTTGLDPSKWVRQRHNNALYEQTSLPLDELRGGPHDPWRWVDGRWEYVANPVWEAACVEFNERFQAYQELKPFPPRDVHLQVRRSLEAQTARGTTEVVS